MTLTLAFGLVAGLPFGFLIGRWATGVDAEDRAIRGMEGMEKALLALPREPCPHCGLMRGDKAEGVTP